MSKINGNDSAFPQASYFDENGNLLPPGMTIRTWLAGQALKGFCANEELTMEGSPKIAHWAVQQADATIKSLNETQEEA